MKKAILVLALILATVSAFGQQTYNPPTVFATAGGASTVSWTAGTVNNGGAVVTVAAGTSSTLSNTQNNCAAPAYSACEIVYSNSSGTVAVSTNIGTATASGNVILAYVTTSGTGVPLVIVYGWQNGSTFSTIGATTGGGTSNAFAFSCGTTTACAATSISNIKLVAGTVALGSASPSTATVTALPFTTTSFTCTASPAGNTAAIAAGGVAITYSTNTVTFTGPNTVTTVINYICMGV